MPAMGFPNPRFTGFQDFGQGTPKQVLVGNTSTLLLNLNLSRVYAQFNNNSNQTIWLAKEIPAVVGKGTRLSPGAMLTFTDNELYLGQVNAITGGSPANIDIEEGV